MGLMISIRINELNIVIGFEQLIIEMYSDFVEMKWKCSWNNQLSFAYCRKIVE